jgi:hypothetical protein
MWQFHTRFTMIESVEYKSNKSFSVNNFYSLFQYFMKKPQELISGDK